jgi:hypothetical protein
MVLQPPGVSNNTCREPAVRRFEFLTDYRADSYLRQARSLFKSYVVAGLQLTSDTRQPRNMVLDVRYATLAGFSLLYLYILHGENDLCGVRFPA